MARAYLQAARILVLFGFAIGFNPNARAQTDLYAKDIHEAEGRALALGGEAVKRLVAYRAQVEKSAYIDTLKLCEGYRQARGYGASEYHAHSMYTFEQSIDSWGKVLSSGFAQPLSTMGIGSVGGPKDDYLLANRVSLLAFESWFGSLYVLYLINSLGFLQGAVHCLNTMDQHEIHIFAATIVAADYESTLASEIGLTWTLGRVVDFLSRFSKYIFFPVRYLQRTLPLRLTKTHITFASLVVVPIAVDNLFDYLNKLESAKKLVKDLLNPSSPLRDEVKEQERLLLISTGFQIFSREYEAGSSQYSEFIQWVKGHIDTEILAAAHADLNKLKALPEQGLTEAQKNAKTLLEVTLRLFDQLPLKGSGQTN